MATTLTHSGYGARHTIRNEFTYDQQGRLLQTTQSTGGQVPVLLAKLEYNALGQLVDKKLHSTDNGASFLQSVDYRYNIRGWLTHLNDRALSDGATIEGFDADPDGNSAPDLFALELKYDQGLQLAGAQQYNGNIAEALWQTRRGSTKTGLKGYAYGYDGVNRLTSASYKSQVSNTWGTSTTDFSVSDIRYDANGNIERMTRQGTVNGSDAAPQKGLLDQLTYYYIDATGKRSNRLLAVDDAAPATAAGHDFEDNGSKYRTASGTGPVEYEYDDNGNLLLDRNKGITRVAYNHLNLPYRIEFGSSANRIEYTYTAAGTKLRKQVFTGGGATPSATTEYAGAFVYEQGQVSFAHTAEGRVLYTASVPAGSYRWKYEYHLKDHLGNLRYAFREEGGNTAQRTASMEPVNAPQEEQAFAHVEETRQQDAQRAHTGRYVARLSAQEGRRQGPTISWPVQAGDSVRAEVYGRYDHTAATGRFLRRGAVVAGAAVAGSPSGGGVERGQPTASRRRFLPYVGAGIGLVPQLFKRKQEELPKAFLRYELFTQDSQLVATRLQPLERTATDEWQHLEAGMKADSAGFVRVSVLNESGTPAYFDDLALKAVDPQQYQENHYDPWGLNLVGIETVNTDYSKFQYNGKEKQTEFDLNWSDYKARMYNSQIGRWNAIDPHATNYYPLSPYSYAGNFPVVATDVDGKDWFISTKTVNGQLQINIRYVAAVLDNSNNNINLNSFMQDQRAMFKSVFQNKNINATLEIRKISSEKDLKSYETLIEIKHDDANFNSDNTKETVAGYSHMYGNYIALNAKTIYASTGKFHDKRTLMHEIGHSGGLVHPFDFDARYNKNADKYGSYDKAQEDVDFENFDNLTNFMNYYSIGNKEMTGRYFGPGTIEHYMSNTTGPATRGQIQSIVNKFWSGELNRNTRKK
ncbi:hypothetical protein DNI29_22185 [Hymenobacter sediminis]|uniref:RHS repeat-associated core domain-containing protein n=1 Tax=Hymenobacter sediminis TaxID=2218621 RepID=UPI000DA6A8E8|nr:RHS repeat-associated core domain-containing protein [Hymenobacter sediminis]RPD44109.1 hypothetical protein DNI29_22185 [Hymenobacter sediminis]